MIGLWGEFLIKIFRQQSSNERRAENFRKFLDFRLAFLKPISRPANISLATPLWKQEGNHIALVENASPRLTKEHFAEIVIVHRSTPGISFHDYFGRLNYIQGRKVLNL